MKLSHIGFIAVMIVVIGVAFAGCTGSTPSTTSAPSAGTPASGAAGTPAAAPAAGSSSGDVSGAGLFSGLSYNWVEYKMSTGSGSDAMTIYMKFNKQTGKCSMRFEGAGASQMQGMPTEMDCSSTGKAQSNPNEVSSDAKVTCSPIDEPVTVPAGAFTATKCTVTSQGASSSVWVVKNKFMVKMESSGQQGSTEMVLNAYG